MQKLASEFIGKFFTSKENQAKTVQEKREDLLENKLLIKSLGYAATCTGLLMAVQAIKTGQDFGPATVFNAAAISAMIGYVHEVPDLLDQIDSKIAMLPVEEREDLAA